MSATPAQTVAKASWYTVALVAATNMMSLLDRNILAILAPQIKADLEIGDAEMGLLYGTVFALFYALFSLPLGRLADGWVRTRLLGIALLAWSVATGLAAFASSFAVLALSRLGVGIGEGATQPAGYSLVYDSVPKERRGLAMAILSASISIGLGASALIGGVAAHWWNERFAQDAPLGLAGWQFAFLVASLPGLPLAYLLYKRPEPVRGGMEGILTPPDPAPFAASGRVLASSTPVVNLPGVLKRGGPKALALNLGFVAAVVVLMAIAIRATSAFSPRPPLMIGGLAINPHMIQWGVVGFGLIVLFSLAQNLRLTDRPTAAVFAAPALLMAMMVGSFQSMINYGIMGFTPSFLMAKFQLSPAVVGLQFGLLAACLGLVGPFISGLLSDVMQKRFPDRGRIWIAIFATGVSPLIAPWVYNAPTIGDFYMRFAVYSVVLTQWLPPLYATMYDLVLPRMRGLLSSMYIVASTILGLGLGPYLVGMISDANGGNLGQAILSINWIAIGTVILLILISLRVGRDRASVQARAEAAGETFA